MNNILNRASTLDPSVMMTYDFFSIDSFLIIPSTQSHSRLGLIHSMVFRHFPIVLGSPMGSPIQADNISHLPEKLTMVRSEPGTHGQKASILTIWPCAHVNIKMYFYILITPPLRICQIMVSLIKWTEFRSGQCVHPHRNQP